MAEDLRTDDFFLPEEFLNAFVTAHGSDARMEVVEQFFECEDISLGKKGTLELKPNKSHQVYLVGSTSLIHIERQGPADTFVVVQPVLRKRGTIAKGVLEGKIVVQMKQGRKLWLLSHKTASGAYGAVRPPRVAQEVEPLTQDDEHCVTVPPIHPDEIVSETSSPRLSAVEDVTAIAQVDPQVFGQLRTTLQNVRLEFWNGNARSQSTETISVAAKKAEEHDLNGAIQSIEMLENLFVRFIEQWEHAFHDAERRVRHGHGASGDAAKLKTHKNHHLQMQSRIAQAKTKFRTTLNQLREFEAKQKHLGQGH